MNKYWRFFIQNTNEFLSYRLRVVLLVLSQFISPLVMIWVFSGIALLKSPIMGQNQIVAYYVFTSILYLFLNSNVDEFVKVSIQDGTLARYFLRPGSFFGFSLVKEFSGRIVRLFLGLPIFAILIIINWTQIKSYSLPPLPLIFLMIFVSFALAFLLSFNIGLLAFWVEEVWGLQNLKFVSFMLLGGAALPYQIFPIFFQNFLAWTPFPYLINWPLRYGFSGNIRFELFMAGAWLVIFFILYKILWNIGSKKYSAMGAS